MAYDVDLAERVRALVGAEPGVTEGSMFGGLAFLVDGHLAVCAAAGGGLLVRVAGARAGDPLDEPHAAPFTVRGREWQGWVTVSGPGVTDDGDLRRWVDRGIAAARALPPGRG